MGDVRNSFMDQPTAANPPPPDELAAEILPPLSFWQQPFVQNVVPLLTSLAIHVSLILIGIFTIKAVVQSRAVGRAEVTQRLL